uniref:Ig-like domain-containing protein n=1 Tax=Scophthalmus maximus TaxID=52904 RepID=A0A8D3AWM9_SCOMX
MAIQLVILCVCHALPLSLFPLHTKAVFTEVPKDMSVVEGEDVEMPCAFKAVSSVPVSLEIQWWYLKEDVSKELPASIPANRSKVTPREATKISTTPIIRSSVVIGAASFLPEESTSQWRRSRPSGRANEMSSQNSSGSQARSVHYDYQTVRVQGNAISHRLSLSKVKKEDEGLYECHVSDLWADDTQEFTVHATLHVVPGDSMAEEAVSHIQNRWPPRNANRGAAGRATSGPGPGPAAGPRLGQGKHWVPHQTQPGLFPFFSSTTTTSVAKSSASPLLGNKAILGRQHGAGCSTMSTVDPVLCIRLLFLHNLLHFLLAH